MYTTSIESTSGVFLIDVNANKKNTTIEVYVSNEYPLLLNLTDNLTNPRKIKKRFNFKNNSAVISWPNV